MATTPKTAAKATKPAARSRPASARTSNGTRAKAQPAAPSPPPQPESTASKLRTPVLAGGMAVAGILGGIVLGAKGLPRKRSRFALLDGVDLGKVDGKKAIKQIGRASKQFGELTRELRKAGEQAERIGDALS